MHGRYVGLDVHPPRRWPPSQPDAQPFGCEHRLQDASSTDGPEIPPIDLLISCTALEHIRHDAAAINTQQARLSPAGWQVHFVPAVASLKIYGPHGFRQYAPADLAALFPRGEIYRMGGILGSRVHGVFSSHQADGLSHRRPRTFRACRAAAAIADRVMGNRRPTMLGVVVPPARMP